MKTITVLGSTGSIGTQTLDVVRNNGDIRVAALAAGNNITLLEAQAREFHPALVSCKTEEGAKALKTALDDVRTELRRISAGTQPSDELVNDITLITKMLNDMKGE